LKFANVLGIEEKNLFSYGSSSGGFAALRFAAFAKGCGVVTINPQTVLPLRNSFSRRFYFKTCFPDMTMEEISAQHADRIDIRSHVSVLRDTRIIYVQNLLDDHHVNVHFPLFCEAMGEDTGPVSKSEKFHKVLFSDKGGHKVAETKVGFQKAMDIISGY